MMFGSLLPSSEFPRTPTKLIYKVSSGFNKLMNVQIWPVSLKFFIRDGNTTIESNKQDSPLRSNNQGNVRQMGISLWCQARWQSVSSKHVIPAKLIYTRYKLCCNI